MNKNESFQDVTSKMTEKLGVKRFIWNENRGFHGKFSVKKEFIDFSR